MARRSWSLTNYEDWLAADQQVFSFLLVFVSKEILVRIAMANTAAEA
jgi:hypothetical protein